MNYRHIYHAGNFADIHKHLVVMMVIAHLQQKEKPFFILDAFAGIGRYDLHAPEPQKTREYEEGVARIMAQDYKNPDLGAFKAMLQPDWEQGYYAGSPLLAARMLRGHDRLTANELHPEDTPALQQNLKGMQGCRITSLDAYESIRGNIPPKERRGAVLIDPPFERPDEFDLLVKNMKDWARRWETGCFIIWYPIKSGGASERLHAAATELGVNRTYISEILLRGRNFVGGLNGAGLLILNTPFQIPERLHALADELCTALGQGCWMEQCYLTNE